MSKHSTMAGQQSVSILNQSPNNSGKGNVKSANELSADVCKILTRMKSEFMSPDGRSVNYAALKTSGLFKEYKQLVQDLCTVDLTSLAEQTKTAFFINIYNALVIHGLCELSKLPESVMKMGPFWRTTSYNLGGHVFSLDHIMHGILRANRPHPSSKTLPFEPTDPRLAFAVKTFDPRVHFALVFGAKSCPAFNVYTPGGLDQQLTAATSQCLQDELALYTMQRQVKVSRLFQWYYSDFGRNDVEAIRWCGSYLPEDKRQSLKQLLHQLETEGMVDINYKEYNWNLNSLH